MKNNKILAASLWNFIGTFLLKAITFLSVPIFTRIMSQSEYGIVSVFGTYISFLLIIIGLSMNTAIPNARIDYSHNFKDYNATIIWYSLFICLAEVILFNIFFDFIQKSMNINRLDFNILLIISYCEYIINSFYKINTVDYKFKINVILATSNAIINTALSLVLIYFMANHVRAKLIGQSIFLCITSVVVFFKIAASPRQVLKSEYVGYSLKIAIPNIGHQISQIIMSQSDKIMILWLCDAASVGLYSLTYNFGLIMRMVWNAVNEVWVPWLFRKLHDKKYNEIIQCSNIYLAIFSTVTAIVVLIAPEFMIFFAPKSYFEAKSIIAPIILSTYFIFLYSFFVNLEIFYKKNVGIAFATMLSALLNIIGNYLWIPVYGYKAAAYTTLFSYVFLFIFHACLSKYVLKVNIYSLWRISVYAAGVSLVSVIANTFLNMPSIRYMILLCILLFVFFCLYKKRMILKQFCNNFRR